MKAEKDLQMLLNEIELLVDNIQRVKELQKEYKGSQWKPYNSNVVGELKHRCVALKQKLTVIINTSTRDYL